MYIKYMVLTTYVKIRSIKYKREFCFLRVLAVDKQPDY